MKNHIILRRKKVVYNDNLYGKTKVYITNTGWNIRYINCPIQKNISY